MQYEVVENTLVISIEDEKDSEFIQDTLDIERNDLQALDDLCDGHTGWLGNQGLHHSTQKTTCQPWCWALSMTKTASHAGTSASTTLGPRHLTGETICCRKGRLLYSFMTAADRRARRSMLP